MGLLIFSLDYDRVERGLMSLSSRVFQFLCQRGSPFYTNFLRITIHLVLRLTASKPQNEVKRGLLLDIVVRESPSVLQLLAGEDQTLLVRRDPFLILNLLLHILNRV